MFPRVPHFAVLAVAATATLVSASTPESWVNLDVRVSRACIAMSDLSRPQLLAQKVSFSDTIGVEIRMIRGYDSRNRFHRKLCAFNRRTSRTEVQEASGWFGNAVRP